MQITVTGEAKEIAALVLALQERQTDASDVVDSVVNLLREKSIRNEPVYQP